MSTWKKVKRSGTFRRAVQKQTEEMMKVARAAAEEIKINRAASNECCSRQIVFLRPAIIKNKPLMLISNDVYATTPASIVETINCTSDSTGLLGVFLHHYFRKK